MSVGITELSMANPQSNMASHIFFLSPFDLKGCIMKEKELKNLRKIIRYALIKIGVQTNLAGFEHLCSAVEIVIDNPNMIRKLCKGVYPKVAKMFKTNPQCVERDIRHAIEIVFMDKSFAGLNRLLDVDLFTIDDKPSNGELIQLLAEYYNLGLYKQDKTLMAILKDDDDK